MSDLKICTARNTFGSPCDKNSNDLLTPHDHHHHDHDHGGHMHDRSYDDQSLDVSDGVGMDVRWKKMYVLRHFEYRVPYSGPWICCGSQRNNNERDPPLTAKGISDCATMKYKLVHDNLFSDVRVVLVSPSRRCLQTAVKMFDVSRVSIEVCALLREVRHTKADIGTPASVLAKEFPQLDFSGLTEMWWCDERSMGMHTVEEELKTREDLSSVKSRVMLTLHMIQSRQERTVCVVTHPRFRLALFKYAMVKGKVPSSRQYDVLQLDSSGELKVAPTYSPPPVTDPSAPLLHYNYHN